MCGRYTLFTEADNPELLGILRDIERKYGPGAVSAGEVFPTGRAPILVAEGRPDMYGARDLGISALRTRGVVINARAETAAQRPMFRESLLRRRCAVPSAGFYEWDARKTKYLFRLPAQPCLYLAGLYDMFGRRTPVRRADDGRQRFCTGCARTHAGASARDTLEAWIHDAPRRAPGSARPCPR